jgi:hypothetical protein
MFNTRNFKITLGSNLAGAFVGISSQAMILLALFIGLSVSTIVVAFAETQNTTNYDVARSQFSSSKSAILTIETTQGNAHVVITGLPLLSQASGRSPTSFVLAAGVYEVQLHASGCKDLFTSLELKAGEQRLLKTKMDCIAGVRLFD